MNRFLSFLHIFGGCTAARGEAARVIGNHSGQKVRLSVIFPGA